MNHRKLDWFESMGRRPILLLVFKIVKRPNEFSSELLVVKRIAEDRENDGVNLNKATKVT